MAIVEMLWDCPTCGAKGIRGRHRECTSCGAPRGEGIKFYMGDKTVVSKEIEDSVGKCPDWQCGFCNSLNSSKLTNCASCGASRTHSSGNYFDMRQRNQQKMLRENKSHQQFVLSQNPVYKPVNRVITSTVPIKFILVLTLIGLFLLGGLLSSLPKTTTVVIEDKQWERFIEIEIEKTFNESGWTLPESARLQRTAREVHHYDDVLDHYESVQVQKSRQVIDHYETQTSYRDLGNGYAEAVTNQTPVYRTEYYTVTEQKPVYRQEPRYQTKYYYEIDRWVTSRTVKTAGTGDDYHWGEVVLKNKEREGTKKQIYRLIFIDEEESQFVSVDKEFYDATETGDSIKVSKSLLGYTLAEEEE